MLLLFISLVICIITLIMTRRAAEEKLSEFFTKGLKIANIVGIVLMCISCIFAVINAVSSMYIVNSVLSDVPSMGIGGTSAVSNIDKTDLNIKVILALIGDLLISGLLIFWHIRSIKKCKTIQAKIIQNAVVYCKQCGAAVAKRMSYCTACGAELNNTQPDIEMSFGRED